MSREFRISFSRSDGEWTRDIKDPILRRDSEIQSPPVLSEQANQLMQLFNYQKALQKLPEEIKRTLEIHQKQKAQEDKKEGKKDTPEKFTTDIMKNKSKKKSVEPKKNIDEDKNELDPSSKRELIIDYKQYERTRMQQSFVAMADRLVKAAKFYYRWDDKSAKAQFERDIDKIYSDWESDHLEAKQKQKALIKLCQSLQTKVDEINKRKYGYKKNNNAIEKHANFIILPIDPDEVDIDRRRSSATEMETPLHEIKSILQNNNTPLISELNALLTMEKQLHKVLKTVTQIGDKDQSLQIIQITEPLYNLTNDQIQEFLSVVAIRNPTKRPIWFQKLCPWNQYYLQKKIRKMQRDCTTDFVVNKKQLNALVRKVFGHSSPTLNQIGLPFHHRVKTVIKKQVDHQWPETFKVYTERCAFPVPDSKYMPETAERLRIAKVNLEQFILSNLSQIANTFRTEWKISLDEILPIHFLIQPFFSPSKNENLNLLREALFQLQSQFVNPLMIKDGLCQVKFISPNRSIIKFQTKGLQTGTRTINPLFIADINRQEEIALIQSVTEFFTTISRCPLFVDTEFPLSIRESVMKYNQILSKMLSNPSTYGHQNWDNQLRRIIDSHKEQKIQTSNQQYQKKSTQLYYLMDAVQKYIRVCRHKESTTDLLSLEMHKSSLEKLIFHLLYGHASQDSRKAATNILEFCDNGCDAIGFDLDDFATMLAFMAKQGEILDYFKPETHSLYLQLYGAIEENGHNDEVSDQNIPGSSARTEGPQICHPGHLTQYPDQLQLKHQLGQLAKAMKERETGPTIQSPLIQLSMIKKSVRELGDAYQNNNGVPDLPKMYFYSFDLQLDPNIAKQINEFLHLCFIQINSNSPLRSFLESDTQLKEILGFKTPSKKTLQLWLCMAEELFKMGQVVATGFGISEQYSDHTSRILQVLESARKNTHTAFITPSSFYFIDSLQNSTPLDQIDFTIMPMPGYLRNAVSRLMHFFLLLQPQPPKRTSCTKKITNFFSQYLLWICCLSNLGLDYQKLRQEILHRSKGMPEERSCVNIYDKFIYWLLCLDPYTPSHELTVFLLPLISDFNNAFEKAVLPTNSPPESPDDVRFEFVKAVIVQYESDAPFVSWKIRHVDLWREWRNVYIRKILHSCFFKGDQSDDFLSYGVPDSINSYINNFSAMPNWRSKIRDYFPQIAIIVFGTINLTIWGLYRFVLLSEEEQEKTKISPRYELSVTFALWMGAAVYAGLSGIIRYCQRRKIETQASLFRHSLPQFLIGNASHRRRTSSYVQSQSQPIENYGIEYSESFEFERYLSSKSPERFSPGVAREYALTPG